MSSQIKFFFISNNINTDNVWNICKTRWSPTKKPPQKTFTEYDLEIQQGSRCCWNTICKCSSSWVIFVNKLFSPINTMMEEMKIRSCDFEIWT